MKRTAAIASLCVLALLWAGLAYLDAAATERSYRDLIRAGDAALQEDQTFQAIEVYSNAIFLRPDSMLAHLRRGETYERRGDLEDAARDFQRASEIDPSAVRPLEALGDVRYRQGRFRRAAETYDRLLQLNDRSAGVARKLALARLRDGSVDGALEALDRVQALAKPTAEDFYLRGVALRQRARHEDAVEAMKSALRLSPGLIPAREELLDLYSLLARRPQELDELQALAGLDPVPARQVALGLAQARAGRVELAVEGTLTSALERAPDQAQIYGAIGRIWMDVAETRNDRGALGKAIEALERAAPTASTTSGILVLYGQALLLAGQVENAERVLQQASERFPVDPEAFLEYATAAERRGHAADARKSLVRYTALVTDDEALTKHAKRIGVLSLRLNQPADAVRWLRRADARAPADTSILLPLADALLRTGDGAGARQVAERGLKVEPTSVPLRAIEIRTRPPVEP